jgi:hypothetical protein
MHSRKNSSLIFLRYDTDHTENITERLEGTQIQIRGYPIRLLAIFLYMEIWL